MVEARATNALDKQGAYPLSVELSDSGVFPAACREIERARALRPTGAGGMMSRNDDRGVGAGNEFEALNRRGGRRWTDSADESAREESPEALNAERERASESERQDQAGAGARVTGVHGVGAPDVTDHDVPAAKPAGDESSE